MNPQVVLVGGSSSVGKTTLARELGRRLGGEYVQVDDLRRAPLPPNPWRREPPELCRILREAAEAMRPVLAGVVQDALAAGRRLVLEGEALDPGFAARYAGDPRVRAVFVIEADESRLARTGFARSAPFRRLPPDERAAVAQTNALYGRDLEAECRLRGLACVASQPWATLVDRAERLLVATRTDAPLSSPARGCPAPGRRRAA